MKTQRFTITLLLLLLSPLIQADTLFEPEHKVVIQVSTDDARSQNIALNNAVNLQKALGPDNIAIEIVAFGPGLGMLTQQSPVKERVTSLALQNVDFKACGNTMKKVKAQTGFDPELLEGIEVVPAGVLHIIQRQKQGFAYVRP